MACISFVDVLDRVLEIWNNLQEDDDKYDDIYCDTKSLQGRLDKFSTAKQDQLPVPFLPFLYPVFVGWTPFHSKLKSEVRRVT